jgi:hypothetical protein
VAAMAVEVALIPPCPWSNWAETVLAAEVNVAAALLPGTGDFDCKEQAPKIIAIKAKNIHRNLRDVNISSTPLYHHALMTR